MSWKKIHKYSLPARPVQGCRGLQPFPAHIRREAVYTPHNSTVYYGHNNNNNKLAPEIHGTSPAAAF